MWEQRNGEKGRNSFKLLPHGGSFKVFYHIALFGRKPFHERTIDLKRKSSRDAKTLSPPSPPSPLLPPHPPPHRRRLHKMGHRQRQRRVVCCGSPIEPKARLLKLCSAKVFFYFWSVSKKSFCYFRQLFVKVRFCILFSFLRRSVFNNRWESPSEATMMWLVLTNDHHISWETETGEEGERSLEQLCHVFKISTKLISNSGQLFFDPKVTLLFKKAFYMTSRWIVMRLMTAKKYLGNQRKSTTKWLRIEQSFATWHFIGRHFSQVVAKNLFLQIYLEPNPAPFHFSNFSFRSGHRAVEANNHPSAVDREKVVKWSILSTWVTRSAFRVSPATTLLSACR